MTANEVKTILTDAGYDFRIWNWDGVLNMICAYSYHEARDLAAKGNTVLAKVYENRAGIIFDALEAAGYFKEE